jgi:fibronectin type 3 domain-containing protein
MRWRRGLRAAGSFVLVAASSIALLQARSGATTASQLTRYPYLTDLVGTSVEVNWATNQSSTAASASWAAVDSAGNCTPTNGVGALRTSITVNNVAEYQWAATLSLPASGTYCYRVFLNGTDLLGSDPSPRFTTQVPAGSNQAFSFAVLGDWGLVDANGNNPDQANLLGQIASSGVSFGVSVGDNSYPSGSQTNYGDLQQTGNNISADFGPSFWTVPGRSIPLFPASGNHGMSSTTSTRSTEQVNWPQSVAASTSGGTYTEQTYCCVNGTKSASYPSSWYAFNAGNTRFYVLQADWANSNVGTGTIYSDDYAAHWTTSDPEYQWLQGDLAAHPSGLKFAFFHFPLYSDQSGQNSDPYLQGAGSLEGLLAANHVSIAFNGHAHDYQRNAPTGPGTFPSYVTGGGGATLAPIGDPGCSSSDAYGIGWSPTSLTGTKCGSAPVPDSATRVFHFLKVTVNGGQVTVAPTDELGRTFDVQTYNFSNSRLPSTVIDSGPSGFTNSTSATFTFHSTQAGATFQCQLDANPKSACTSPVAYSGLAGGAHTFWVQASTSAGPDPNPPTASWTVDTTPPSAPSGLSATASSPSLVNLAWSASTDANGIAAYNILRNGSALASVSGSTLSYPDKSVAGGTTYQYQVIAVDPAGNASAASNTATVTTPAGTSTTASVATSQAAFIYSGTTGTNYGSTDPLLLSASAYRTLLEFDTSSIPAGATITSANLVVTPTLSETSGGVEVHPDTSGWNQSTVTWANQPTWNTTVLGTSALPTAGQALSVALPTWAVNTGGLTDLGLRYSATGIVVKIDGASNPGHPVLLVTYNSSGGTTLPDTLIDSGPSGYTTTANATFTFHATQSGASFQCQLDASPAAACTSPVTYGGLADGAHSFSVQASTSSGSDPTPATASWTVDTTPPSAPSGLGATAASPSLVNLAWSASSDANGIAAYNILRNGIPLAGVSGSTLSYSDKSVTGGTAYQYQVIAVDPAGNASAASNTATVTTPTGTATTTVSLATRQAAYVYSGSSGTNFGSTDPLLFSASSYRTLLEFDTSSIPAGATITSVSLAVTPTLTETSGGVEVHPEASGWSQSTLTWANQPSWNAAVLGTSAIPTAGQALSVALPASAVTAAGFTDLGFRFTTSGIIFKIDGASNTAHPVLSVTYTTG